VRLDEQHGRRGERKPNRGDRNEDDDPPRVDPTVSGMLPIGKVRGRVPPEFSSMTDARTHRNLRSKHFHLVYRQVAP